MTVLSCDVQRSFARFPFPAVRVMRLVQEEHEICMATISGCFQKLAGVLHKHPHGGSKRCAIVPGALWPNKAITTHQAKLPETAQPHPPCYLLPQLVIEACTAVPKLVLRFPPFSKLLRRHDFPAADQANTCHQKGRRAAKLQDSSPAKQAWDLNPAKQDWHAISPLKFT